MTTSAAATAAAAEALSDRAGDVAALTAELKTVRELFCGRCYTFDCHQHGVLQPNKTAFSPPQFACVRCVACVQE